MRAEVKLLLLLFVCIILNQSTSKKGGRQKNHPNKGKPTGFHNQLQKGAPLENSHREEWKKFKKHYRRNFSPAEDEKRFSYFQKRKDKISNHNSRWKKGHVSFKVNFNRFSDMDENRVKRLMNGFRRDKTKKRKPYLGFSRPLLGAQEYIPPMIDWRINNTVSPVRDQGPCASCWSFTSIGSIESQLAVKRGYLTPLSVQYLIDCSTNYGNFGCKGGQPDNAFQFIKEKGGIVPEDSYPYNASQGQCHLKENSPKLVDISGHIQLPVGDEYALMKAVWKVGPICAAIDASRWTFHAYAGGIYDDPECSSENLDHSVLVVGYGSENGTDYWIVKNSWGPNWGEQGYVRMSRNKKNQCGIASFGSYPIV